MRLPQRRRGPRPLPYGWRLKIAYVGSAGYPAGHTRRVVKKASLDAIALLGGEEGFDVLVRSPAVDHGLQALKPHLDRRSRKPERAPARARAAVDQCDLLIAFWDGSSQDLTQQAAQTALQAGKPFEVYGPAGAVIRAGNQGTEVHAPNSPRHELAGEGV